MRSIVPSARSGSCLPLLLLLGAACLAARGAGLPVAMTPPLVRVPPIDKPPVIDGVLAPGEWDRAFMGTGVSAYKQTGLDPLPVQYWFAYDAEAVYFAARMQTRPGENYATRARRLAGGGPSGHFEILIDPNPGEKDHNWVQAMMYPLGVYRNVGYSQRIGGYVPYEVEWNYKDAAQDDWWSIEFSAPIADLHHASIEDGDSWGILFAGRIAGAMHYFSGTLGGRFNDRAEYLKMVFDRQAPVVRIRDMGDVAGGSAAPQVAVVNTTAQPLDLTATFTLREDRNPGSSELKTDTQKATVAPGAEAPFAWSIALPDDDSHPHLFITVATQEQTLYEGIYKLSKPRLPLWAPREEVPVEPVIFEAYDCPYFNRVRALADFGGLDNPDAVASARFAVKDAAGRELASAETATFDNLAAEQVVPLDADLADGVYTCEAALLDKTGNALAQVADTFERGTFPFEHNTIGVSDRVLYPWTPIRVDEGRQTLAFWNRTVALGDDGLPAAVFSAGRQLLAEPIALRQKRGGRWTPLRGKGLRFTKVADHAVEAVATAEGPSVRAEIRLRAEYDGMLEYTVALTGETNAAVDGLDLVLPIKAEHARFIHAAGDGCRSNYSHELPQGRGTVWDATEVMNWVMPRAWLTYLWLGDYERGVCWWADSAEGWTLPRAKREPAVEIERDGRTVRALFHLITPPATALWADREPRRIVFALDPTPVRPKPRWALDIGTNPSSVTMQNGPRFDWIGYTGWCFKGQEEEFHKTPGHYTFAHLRPVNEQAAEALKAYTDAKQVEGRRTLVYTDMRARALSHADEKAYAWEWLPSRQDLRKQTVAKAPQWFGVPISSTQSRIDHDIWCCNLGMDLGVDYWYFDEIQNEGQINPATDLGYRDEDGAWLPTMRLMQYRQFWKRLYTLMQERGQPEPLIVMHNTSTTYAGPMAFCTATWDFEDSNPDPARRHLTKYGMDYLITETMGHQYGFAASTLGGHGRFDTWLPDHPEEELSARRHWMGIHMLLRMNPYLSRGETQAEGLATLGRFGWNQPDCRWFGFWKARELGLYDYAPDDHVYVSAYHRDGRALLIALNDRNEDLTMEWRPGKALGASGPLTDAQTGEVIQPSGGTYGFDLPHYNYRALLVRADGGR